MSDTHPTATSDRPAPRPADQMRPVSIAPFDTGAAGSVLIEVGGTRVLCTASIEADPPRWIPRNEAGEPEHGWVTAEYQMLPGSTPQRKRRGPDGRGTEIQRLIGRSLRAAVDLKAMPGLAIYCDCDVLRADGGTRTASITGACVALALALDAAKRDGRLAADAEPMAGLVAAVSVGVVEGRCVLDLDYPLDSAAEVDMNVVMNQAGEYVELQGTGESATFTGDQLTELLALARRGVDQLLAAQQDALAKLRG